MAVKLLTALLVLVIGFPYLHAASAICPSLSFVMGSGDFSGFCYQYVASPADWFTANKTCQSRGDNASLLWIDTDAENTYVRNNFFALQGNKPFWIGLNDVTTEGVFKWARRFKRSNYEGTLTYSGGWATGSMNTPVLDCVEFTSSGWVVNVLYCTQRLNFVCKEPVCSSLDGVQCDSSALTVSTDGGTVAGAVIGVIVFIIVLALILALVLLWKFQNDKFYRYLCCCIYTKTQPAIHSLQQENQRLRQELAQQKLSLSGRFPQGGMKEEGPKATMGPSLPHLKPQVSSVDLGTSLNSSMSFGKPDGPRMPTMSPPPLPTLPVPMPVPRMGGAMLPPLISPLPLAPKVTSPFPPKVGMGLPPINRSFPPLRNPLSPIAEMSPVSPPPGTMGQNLVGTQFRPTQGAFPLPGRGITMAPLRGPLPQLGGVKLPPQLEQSVLSNSQKPPVEKEGSNGAEQMSREISTQGQMSSEQRPVNAAERFPEGVSSMDPKLSGNDQMKNGGKEEDSDSETETEAEEK